MGRADSLSRRVDWAEGGEKDNENQIMLKEEWLEVRAMEWLVEGPEEEIVKRIKEARDKDEEVIKVVEEMKKAGVKTLRDEEWQIEEGLVLKEGRVYVLKDKKLRVEIIRLHHDTPIAGHGGQWKMVELVTRNYWWPGVTKEVKRYMEGCDQYQKMKNRAEMSRSLMVDSILFSLFTLFYLLIFFFIYFSIFRTAQVRGYQSHCHISHKT